MLVKPGQPEKQPSPKEVTEEGIVMLVKPEQPEKQLLPKEVTEEGIVMLVKPLHHSKQLLPKEVTEEGIVMLVKPEYVFANAFISITYVLNGRKVTAKILKRSEKMKI